MTLKVGSVPSRDADRPVYLSLNFVVQSFESIQNDTLEDGLRPLFFLQKLTSHQKKLIEDKHDDALKFHIIPSLRPSPDISPDVMKKSESKFWLDQIKTSFEGKVCHISYVQHSNQAF